jgi:hypothetical protein
MVASSISSSTVSFYTNFYYEKSGNAWIILELGLELSDKYFVMLKSEIWY